MRCRQVTSSKVVCRLRRPSTPLHSLPGGGFQWQPTTKIGVNTGIVKQDKVILHL